MLSTPLEQFQIITLLPINFLNLDTVNYLKSKVYEVYEG